MDTIRVLLEWVALIGGLAAVLVGPTTAAVGVVKTLLDGRVSTRYYPATSVFVGTALGAVIALAAPFVLSTWDVVLAGAVAGSLASKLYADAATRDAAKVGLQQPSTTIVGIPTVPTGSNPHPGLSPYVCPSAQFGSSITDAGVAHNG